MLTLIVLTAICLDVVLAEPRRLHPLVGFGRCADWVESKSRRWQLSPRKQGVAAVLALLLPLFFLALALQIWLHHQPAFWFWLIAGVVVYGCIALRSLHEHAQAVYRPLLIGNMELARLQLSRIVSRDCAALDEQQVASACCESVLENGSDGVLGAIFWFCRSRAARCAAVSRRKHTGCDVGIPQ